MVKTTVKVTTVCIRCGKARIESDSYQKKEGSSVIIYTKMICPDPECQKLVDKELAKEKKKRDKIKEESAKREGERIARLKKTAKSKK